MKHAQLHHAWCIRHHNGVIVQKRGSRQNSGLLQIDVGKLVNDAIMSQLSVILFHAHRKGSFCCLESKHRSAHKSWPSSCWDLQHHLSPKQSCCPLFGQQKAQKQPTAAPKISGDDRTVRLSNYTSNNIGQTVGAVDQSVFKCGNGSMPHSTKIVKYIPCLLYEATACLPVWAVMCAVDSVY